MKHSIYLVQSQNISKGYTLGVEKYIQNTDDNVVSSHGVVELNALSIL